MAAPDSSIEVESRETDALTHLEDRVQKTVALVTRLRHEKDAVARELATAQATVTAAQSALEESQLANMQLTDDLNALRAEKLQVRNRLEKLLGHIDQLGAV
jgi:hypothetical protein